MNVGKKVIVSVLFALVPMTAMAQLVDGSRDPRLACRNFGGISGQVCPTSFIRLIAHPEIFADKKVAVQGWPKQLHGTFYLFLDKSSADNNLVENALICISGCDRLVSRVGVRTTLIGGFTTKIRRADLFTPVGAIEVELIREID